MRIISGKYKGKRFDVHNTFKSRPTTDFAKEGLFNILSNHYIDFDAQPIALDLFSGTGSISLELLSRGCGRVVSVEKDFKHCQFLQKTAKALGDPNYDFIFADPPYSLENLAEIPDLVLSQDNILNEGGLFVLEHGKTYDFTSHPRCIDHRAYGSVNFTFFE